MILARQAGLRDNIMLTIISCIRIITITISIAIL